MKKEEDRKQIEKWYSICDFNNVIEVRASFMNAFYLWKTTSEYFPKQSLVF